MVSDDQPHLPLLPESIRREKNICKRQNVFYIKYYQIRIIRTMVRNKELTPAVQLEFLSIPLRIFYKNDLLCFFP
jgi:hypothetical protein